MGTNWSKVAGILKSESFTLIWSDDAKVIRSSNLFWVADF